jgi:hypothetical protein
MDAGDDDGSVTRGEVERGPWLISGQGRRAKGGRELSVVGLAVAGGVCRSGDER